MDFIDLSGAFFVAFFIVMGIILLHRTEEDGFHWVGRFL